LGGGLTSFEKIDTLGGKADEENAESGESVETVVAKANWFIERKGFINNEAKVRKGVKKN
jgi:hypothetical protein